MFLLDTQLAFWWQTGDSQIPDAAVSLISNNSDPVFVSRVSLWELAIKASIGKLRIDLELFAEQINTIGFTWLPLENKHILKVATLPLFHDHKDPFDRLLVAQSMSDSLILVTTDTKLERYGKTIRVL